MTDELKGAAKAQYEIIHAQVSSLQESYYNSIRDAQDKFNQIDATLGEMRKTIFSSTSTLASNVFSLEDAVKSFKSEYTAFTAHESAERAKRQRKADIKDYIFLGLGCLVICIGLAVIATLFIALWLLWYKGVLQ